MPTTLGNHLSNSQATVTIASSYGAIDPNTGNPTPVITTFNVEAWLKVSHSKAKDSEQPDNPSQQWVEGYVTRVVDAAQPAIELAPRLPEAIEAAIPITISGVAGKIFFERLPINGAILQYGHLNKIGEKICGWFETGRA